MTLSAPYIKSGRGGREKNVLPYRESSVGHPAHRQSLYSMSKANPSEVTPKICSRWSARECYELLTGPEGGGTVHPCSGRWVPKSRWGYSVQGISYWVHREGGACHLGHRWADRLLPQPGTVSHVFRASNSTGTKIGNLWKPTQTLNACGFSARRQIPTQQFYEHIICNDPVYSKCIL
jgi:hypothetical protein